MGYFGLQLSLRTLYYIGGFGLVTFLYAIPFLPKRFFIDQEKNLRSVVGLKIYLIALVWMGVTVFLPVIEHQIHVDQSVIIIALQRFLIVLVLMLPFEIRDLRYDSLRLSTVPQQIGVKLTKIIGTVLLFVTLFLNYFIKTSSDFTRGVLLVIILILFLLLITSNKEQGKYHSAFWVEGVPVFWLLLRLLEYY
ncbi:hypothetical protein GCM10022260_12330 [Gaetbulibacter aestuarii]